MLRLGCPFCNAWGGGQGLRAAPTDGALSPAAGAGRAGSHRLHSGRWGTNRRATAKRPWGLELSRSPPQEWPLSPTRPPPPALAGWHPREHSEEPACRLRRVHAGPRVTRATAEQDGPRDGPWAEEGVGPAQAGAGGPARGPRGSSPPLLPLTRTRGPWSRAPAEASTSSPGQTTRRALGQKEENGNFSHGVRSEPLPGDHDPHATVRPACPTWAEGPLVAGPALTWAQLSPQEAEGHVWGSTRSHSCPRPARRSPDTGCPGGGPGRPPTWISAARGRSACLPTRHRAGAHGRWAC